MMYKSAKVLEIKEDLLLRRLQWKASSETWRDSYYN